LQDNLDDYDFFDGLLMIHTESITTRRAFFFPIEFGEAFI